MYVQDEAFAIDNWHSVPSNLSNLKDLTVELPEGNEMVIPGDNLTREVTLGSSIALARGPRTFT